MKRAGLITLVAIIVISCGLKEYSMEEAQEITGVYYIRMTKDYQSYMNGEMKRDDFVMNIKYYHGRIIKTIEKTKMTEMEKKYLINTFDMYCNAMINSEVIE